MAWKGAFHTLENHSLIINDLQKQFVEISSKIKQIIFVKFVYLSYLCKK